MSSNAEVTSLFAIPITSLEYRDMASHLFSDTAIDPLSAGRRSEQSAKHQAEVEMSEAEFAARILQERADATLQAETRMRQEYEQKLQAARAPIANAITEFEGQRDEYFARVEAEVVQLALSISAKILHREAQVDPMLLASLVRISVEKMREGSTVTVRVGRGRAPLWKDFMSRQSSHANIVVVEDITLSDHDCVLETEMGVTNFGLDTQLKEVEQGFFDLLALRPVTR
jgi:flagellar assembly protein FliH